MRVVSLIASSTEITCALGFQSALVGRSHECDFPPSVRELPCLTSTKFQPDGTSYQIDERIKAILQEGLSVYRVDAEHLRKLQPDLILTQTQCEVCAVSLKDVESALHCWMQSAPAVISLAPQGMDDLWADIRTVAKALGSEARGEALVKTLQSRVEEVKDAVAARLPRTFPKVACIEWMDPLMAAGNWVPEMVNLAGGVNLFGQARKHSPWMEWEALVESEPDVIVTLPCGFDIRRTMAEFDILTKKPGFDALKCVKEGKVYVADGNQYFNRPGPRLVDSLEILAEIIHPECLGNPPRWEGVGYERYRST